MNLKQVLAGVFVIVCTSFSYADSASFQSQCIDAWMKKGETSSDKVDYKNFGEKYCGCAANQPLDNDAAVQKAIQVCMSRTLLHDAMDSLEEEVGLAEAKDTDVKEYCQDRWALLYPTQSDAEKKITTAYCDCAQPKLLELIKQSENMTDKQYDDGINSIAEACSGTVANTASTTTPSANTSPAQ